jgi:hypothetical protein
LRSGADRSCRGRRGHECSGESKKNFYSEGKEEKREIRGRVCSSFLGFLLFLDNPKSFIWAVINAWGLVVGTQFTKC